MKACGQNFRLQRPSAGVLNLGHMTMGGGPEAKGSESLSLPPSQVPRASRRRAESSTSRQSRCATTPIVWAWPIRPTNRQ